MQHSPSLLLNMTFSAWGDDSVDKVLTTQTWGTRVLTPRSGESQMGVQIYNSSSPAGTWEMKAEEFPAASRPVSLCTQWKTTETLSYTKWKAETATQSCPLTSTPHQSIHTLEFTHTNTCVCASTHGRSYFYEMCEKQTPWSNNRR